MSFLLISQCGTVQKQTNIQTTTWPSDRSVFSFEKANNEEEDLTNIFRVFDREDEGCINVNELKNIWNNYLFKDISSQDVSNKA